MDNKNIQTIAIILAGFGTLALVYFAYKQTSGNSGASGETNVSSFPVITGAPVDSVGIANAQVALRNSELSAYASGFQSLIGYALGTDTNQTNLGITQISSASNERIAQIAGDVARYEATTNAHSLEVQAQTQAETLRYVSDRQSAAQIEQARYTYEAQHQQQRTARHNGVTGVIGGIISGIFKFL